MAGLRKTELRTCLTLSDRGWGSSQKFANHDFMDFTEKDKAILKRNTCIGPNFAIADPYMNRLFPKVWEDRDKVAKKES